MRDLLVVVDMQADFINGALGTPEAEAIVPAVIARIREFEGDVVYTQDTHGADYMDTQEGRKLPVIHCVKGTPGWEIPQEILAAGAGKTAAVLEKPTFGSAALGELVRKADYSSIELLGLCTDVCVIANAISLKPCVPETPIRVRASCCAGVTPENHEIALRAMQMGQIEIV